MLELTTESIDLDALVRAVRTAACGAVVTFSGVVRETSPDDPRAVRSLRYEAYATLALTQLGEIAAATRAAFGPLEIAIVHRTGELTVGETSVAIAVAAPHRAAAFDGCEHAIDAIKARLAVWKQEIFADGEAEWRPNTRAVTPPAGPVLATAPPPDEVAAAPALDEAPSPVPDEAVPSR